MSVVYKLSALAVRRVFGAHAAVFRLCMSIGVVSKALGTAEFLEECG